MRAIAVGAASALEAIAYAMTAECVGAWGRFQVPPRAWQILWCMPMPQTPSVQPASQAP